MITRPALISHGRRRHLAVNGRSAYGSHPCSQAALNNKPRFRFELLKLVHVRVHFAQRFHLR